MKLLNKVFDWILSYFSSEAKLLSIINSVFTKEVQQLIFDLVVLAQQTNKEDGSALTGAEKKELVLKSMLDIKGEIGDNIKSLVRIHGMKIMGDTINLIVELLKIRGLI